MPDRSTFRRLAQSQQARLSSNPWMKAAEVRRAHAAMQSALTEVELHVYTLEDGEAGPHVVHVLGHLGWIIGAGSEVAMATQGPGSAQARRLHSVLRTLQQVCLAGYAWRRDFAGLFADAAEQSHALMKANAPLVLQLQAGADYLSARIRSQALTAGDVAGAELYQRTYETAPA